MSNRMRTLQAGSCFTAVAVAAGFFSLLLAGCSRGAKTDPTVDEQPEVQIEEVQDGNVVEVQNPDAFPLAAAEPRRFTDQLEANGVVAPDVSRTVPVVSLAGGRVGEVLARLGDDVQKGQVLLRINSPDLAAAFSDYQKFQADAQLARKQLDRSQELYAKGAAAQKDLQVAEGVEQKARVDRDTAAERLRILGAEAEHPSSIIEVRAPASGTIVEQNVTMAGGVKSLDNSPSLFTIADLSRLWVVCDVYENNLAQVHVGDMAEVRLNAYPDRRFRGQVNNIGRILDPATRTAKVRLELDNPGGLMRPNMFAVVTFLSPSSQNRVVVPATAVLRLHDRAWVFRPEGDKRFRRVEVKTGAVSADGLQEILAGLAPNERVVKDALQFLSAAEAR